MGGGGSASASEAANLVFRIATVGLSLASAIMTAASTQCVYRDTGVPAGTVSYADYNSFKYSAVADLLSAVLQGVAIYLEATRKGGRASRAVELIDKLVQALTSTSAALLLAVDDITSGGGPPPRRGTGRQRQSGGGGLCGQAGAFCGRVRVASAFSIAATVSVSASVYTRHAPVAAILAPRPPAPAVTVVNVNVERRDEGRRRRKKEREAEEKGKVVVEPILPEKTTEEEVETKEEDTKEEEEKKKKENEEEEKLKVAVELIVPEKKKKTTEEEVKAEEETKKGEDQVKKDDEGKEKKKDDEAEEEEEEEQCRWSTLRIQAPPATMMPPPWCRCPRLTIPCDCEDPDLCGAFF